MRYFLVAAAVVAVIASTAVYAADIKLTSQEQAECQVQNGCFLMSFALLQQMLGKARAEGCKGPL